jgi:SAM-dependent methyltransferase
VARLAEGGRAAAWVGLERSIDCLPAMRRLLSAGAIVDLEDLRRLPGGFGVVLAADCLEHLGSPERILRLIHAALPPGGLLLVSVPNVANLYVRLALLCGRFPYADCGILDRSHRVFFTRSSLARMLDEAGFTIERRAVSTIPLPLLLRRVRRPLLDALGALLAGITRLLPTVLGYQLLAVARRSPAGEGNGPA